jgi:glycosyltransferase involved in cell wall biosynthesis
MTITFFTNYVHHHQIPLADEMFNRIGDNYKYVAMEKLPDSFVKGGYDPMIERSYIIRAYESEIAMKKAQNLMLESDVVIGIAGPKGYSEKRQDLNKITFNYSERWIKRSFIHAIDPRVLYRIYKSFFKYRNKRSYMLCASAFAAKDANLYFCYPNKCYKWGYFPKVESPLKKKHDDTSEIKIMWCSRFIDWKHPELPVKLAARLKRDNVNFAIDMYGDGVLHDNIQRLIKTLGVDDVVRLKGNLPNEDILQQMRNHEIFLFTSDKGEGWGAVLNESMSQGCAVVASDMIGAAPFLIEDGRNGLLFKSEDVDSLYVQVKRLFDDDALRITLSENAIRTMQDVWNPKVAAERFLHLVDRMLQNKDTDFVDGPCSKAYPYK